MCEYASHHPPGAVAHLPKCFGVARMRVLLSGSHHTVLESKQLLPHEGRVGRGAGSRVPLFMCLELCRDWYYTGSSSCWGGEQCPHTPLLG